MPVHRRSGSRAVRLAWIAVAISTTLTGVANAQTPPAPDGPEISGVSTAVARFAGIPAHGMVVGRPEAAVRIVVYGDLACPICVDASPTLVRRIIRRYVRPGRAALELRLLAFYDSWSLPAALGTYAAAAQDAGWPFATAVLANHDVLGAAGDDVGAPLESIAQRLGLDVDRWRAGVATSAVAAALARDGRRADDDRVLGTPTFVLRGPRGRRVIEGNVGMRTFAAGFAAVAPHPARPAHVPDPRGSSRTVPAG